MAPVHNPFGFGKFPPEILQEIAVYLPDKDLGSFALIQKTTCDAIIPPNAGHWRERFVAQFDLPAGKSPIAIKTDYKLRKRFLNHLIHFKYGQSQEERACLSVIRQLIVEKSQGPVNPSPYALCKASSFNVRQLWRFMKKSNLMHDAFRWTRFEECSTNRLLEVIQVYFFAWNVWCGSHDMLAAYPYSLRRTVYSVETSEFIATRCSSRSLVDAAGQIDFTVLSHLANLWKFHMAINDEGKLYHMIQDDQAPTACSLYPSGTTRSQFESHYTDHQVHTQPWFTGGNRLLDLTFASTSRRGQWPKAFEKEIDARPSSLSYLKQSMTTPEKLQPIAQTADKSSRPKFTKVTPKSGIAAYEPSLPLRQDIESAEGEDKSKHSGKTIPPKVKTKEVEQTFFHGRGELDVNHAPANIAGIAHSLPPQEGIPGWQRFTMVAYETPATGDEKNGYLDANEEDLCPYLLYEGVVLPGGSVIIGRYSMGNAYDEPDNPDLAEHRGSFIYWRVQSTLVDIDGDG
ncbi:MAG: hypothetical protein Q9166_000363 [cf. Caloplaca sp. 2 TL-2023]